VWKEVSLVLVILGGGFLLHRQHDRKDGPHFGEVFSHSLILVK
jgi:hypothetical protein